MKLMHLSDLHLGKRVNGFSMLEEQRFILEQILQLVHAEHPQGVLLAGDLFDKPTPPAEAVSLLDDFLAGLSHLGCTIFAISGNHDSPERIAYGGRLLRHSGVHMSPVYGGSISPITLEDDLGPVDFYLLPFLKPAYLRSVMPETEIHSCQEAVEKALEGLPVDPRRRNVLVAHQFVAGAQVLEQEELLIGGSDGVDAALFRDFDYVALGHLHGPQSVGRDTLRYCGTPLKYSFAEASHHKSVTLVELDAKGQVTLNLLPLTPQHDLREIRGTYDQVMDRSSYTQQNRFDYLHITLTDEEDVPDAIGRLRTVYPNLMKLDYDNRRTRETGELLPEDALEHQSPLELFGDFYRMQNNKELDDAQLAYLNGLTKEIWEEEV